VTRRLAIGIALLAVAACGRGSSRLEGKWKGLRADGVPAEAQARANDFAMAMELEVKGDTISIKSPSDKQTGKYKVVEDSKSKLVIVTDKDGPDDKQTFTFSDDKTMKWSVTDGKTITFVRQ
jgi:hypothetical protein